MCEHPSANLLCTDTHIHLHIKNCGCSTSGSVHKQLNGCCCAEESSRLVSPVDVENRQRSGFTAMLAGKGVDRSTGTAWLIVCLALSARRAHENICARPVFLLLMTTVVLEFL